MARGVVAQPNGAVLALVVATVALAIAVGCQPAPKPDGRLLSEAQRDANIQSLEAIYRTVLETHWRPASIRERWRRARDDYRPLIRRAPTMAAARAQLRGMLARLDTSHYAVYAGSTADATSESGETAGLGLLDFDLRLIGGRLIITEVRSKAAHARGIRPGWALLAAGGQSVARVLEALPADTGHRERQLRAWQALAGRLRGRPGTQVSVRLLDGDEREVAMRLPRTRPEEPIVRSGLMPATPFRFTARRLGDGTGYIRFNAFIDSRRLMQRLSEAMARLHEARGLILDLRGNDGGLAKLAGGVAGWLVASGDASLGRLTRAGEATELQITPQPLVYDGPVVVLIDGLTMSTAEYLTAGLKALGRARTVGSRSAGAALPSRLKRLPNGDVLQFAVARYLTPKGEDIEGRGIAPDVTARLSREALLAGRDPLLSAARRELARQIAEAESQ